MDFVSQQRRLDEGVIADDSTVLKSLADVVVGGDGHFVGDVYKVENMKR